MGICLVLRLALGIQRLQQAKSKVCMGDPCAIYTLSLPERPGVTDSCLPWDEVAMVSGDKVVFIRLSLSKVGRGWRCRRCPRTKKSKTCASHWPASFLCSSVVATDALLCVPGLGPDGCLVRQSSCSPYQVLACALCHYITFLELNPVNSFLLPNKCF